MGVFRWVCFLKFSDLRHFWRSKGGVQNRKVGVRLALEKMYIERDINVFTVTTGAAPRRGENVMFRLETAEPRLNQI